MRPVYPPKLCITIVLDFSWDDCYTQENGYEKFWGVNKEHYGLCESSELYYGHIITIIFIKHNSPKTWTLLFMKTAF